MSTGKSWAVGFLAVLALVGGGWFVSFDPGPVHRYDADLNRLAATELESICAATVYISSNGNGNKKDAASCREQFAHANPNVIAYDRVIPVFCTYVAPRLSLSWNVCVSIMEVNELWPARDGFIVSSWNDSNPWPGEVFQVRHEEGDDPEGRTGDREELSR